jgi:hypothetical protein
MIKPKTITMEFKDFLKEHKRLIKTLEKGDKATLKKEATKQKKELKKYLK